MSSNKYDDEFRKQLLDLVQSKTMSVSEVARKYGVSKVTLHSWIKKYNNSSSFRAIDQLTPEQKEIKELKKKLKETEEVEILKKATAIFSRLTK